MVRAGPLALAVLASLLSACQLAGAAVVDTICTAGTATATHCTKETTGGDEYQSLCLEHTISVNENDASWATSLADNFIKDLFQGYDGSSGTYLGGYTKTWHNNNDDYGLKTDYGHIANDPDPSLQWDNDGGVLGVTYSSSRGNNYVITSNMPLNHETAKDMGGGVRSLYMLIRACRDKNLNSDASVASDGTCNPNSGDSNTDYRRPHDDDDDTNGSSNPERRSVCLRIDVQDVNDPPVDDTADSTTFGVDETQATGVPFGPNLLVSDEDGDTLTWTITSTGGAPVVLQNSTGTSNRLQLTAPLDAEPTVDTFAITIDVTDGTVTITLSLSMTEVDVNEVPVHTSGALAVTVPETQATGNIGAALTVTDEDLPADTLTWSVLAPHHTLFGFTAGTTTSGGSKTLQLLSALNYESATSHTITVRVNDGAANLDLSYTVTVTDVNEVPVHTSGALAVTVPETQATGNIGAALTVTDEDLPADTLTWSVLAPHHTLFGFTAGTTTSGGSKTLQLLSALNYESATSHSITVRVNDGAADLDLSYTVTVTDVNEVPVHTSGALAVTVPETQATGNIGAALTVTDEDLPADTLTWSVLAPHHTLFGFTAGTTTSGGSKTLQLLSALNYESATSHTITVRVNDGAANLDLSYTVTVTDVNDLPLLTTGSSTSVDENVSGDIAFDITFTDEDSGPDTLTWSINSITPASGLFSLTPSGTTSGGGTKRLTLSSGANHEAASSYAVTVRVSDGTGFTDEVITVTINDVDEQPYNLAPAALSIPEGTTGTLATYTAADEDASTTLTWSITGGNPGSFFSITSGGVLTSNPIDFESPPTSYSLQVQVTDGDTAPVSITTSITITDVNEAPVLTTPGPFTVGELYATATCFPTLLEADDPDTADTNIAFALVSQTPSSPAIFSVSTTGGHDGCIQVSSTMDHETVASFTLAVRMCDNEGNPTTVCHDQNVVINVSDEPEAPSSPTPVGPVSVSEGTPHGTLIATLDAFDPEGADLTWAFTGGQENMTLTNSLGSSATLTVNGFLDHESASSIVVSFTVSDNEGFNVPHSFTINILDVDEAPVPHPQALDIDENLPPGSTVGTLSAYEPEGQPVTWSIPGSGAPDQASFTVTSGGVLQTVGSFNFESKSTYTVRVDAEDSTAHVGFRIYTVTVNDVPEDPTVADRSDSVDENSPVSTTVTTLVFSDPEDGTTGMTFSITAGDPTGWFAISNAGVITVARAPLNFEEDPSFVLTVELEDSTSRTDTATVTITVNDINENPIVASGQTRTIDEAVYDGELVGAPLVAWDWDNDTISWSIEAGDPNGVFSIHPSTGQLEISDNSTVDYETTTSYSLTIRATDNGAPILTGDAVVVVSVSDVNDIPVVSAHTYTLPENSPDGTVITTGGVGLESLPTYTSDEDTNALFDGPWTFDKLSGDPRFEVLSDGNIRVAAGYGGEGLLNFEVQSSYSITVRARDQGGEYSAGTLITINLTNEPEAPYVEDLAVTINENVALAAAAVPTMVFSDQDTADTHTCALEAPRDDQDPLDPGNFLFDVTATPPCTIRRASAYKIDYEHTMGSYSVTLRVTDSGSLSNTSTIDISVIDQREPPRWVSDDGQWDPRFPDAAYVDTATVAEVAPAGTTVFQLFAFDEDAGQNATISYSIQSVSNGGATYFTVDSGTGVISTTPVGHFALDAEAGIVYSITVRATDSQTDFTDGTIQVSVGDSPEAPVFINSTRFVYENAAVGFELQSLPLTAGLNDGHALESTDSDTGSSAAFFIIDGNTEGVLGVSPPGPSQYLIVQDPGATPVDFERTSFYNLTMRVTDGTGLHGYGTMDIVVVDVDDPPVITSPSAASVEELLPSGTPLYQATFTDEDGDDCAWSITAGADPNGPADFIVTPGGELRTNKVLDYEVDPKEYNITLQCINDNAGSKPTPWGVGSASLTVRVAIIDKNDAPIMNDVSFSVDENSPPGTVLGTAAASDQDLALGGQTLTWSIIGASSEQALFAVEIAPMTGQITLSSNVSAVQNHEASLDFEDTPVFTITVRVVDDGSNDVPLDDTCIVTVSLNDLNEAPIVDFTTMYISENAPPGSQASFNRSGWEWWGQEASALRSPFFLIDVLGLNDVNDQIALQTAHDALIPSGDGFVVQDGDLGASQSFTTELYLLSGTGFQHAADTAYVTSGGTSTARITSMTDASYPAPAGQCCSASPRLSRGDFLPGTNSTLGRGLYTFDTIPRAVFAFDSVARVITLVNGTLNAEATPQLQFLVKVQDDGTGGIGAAETAYFLLNVEVVDVNEPSTQRLSAPATISMNENALIGDVIADTFLTPQDVDNQTLFVKVEDSSANYFNMSPIFSDRDVNGTRLPSVFEVIQPFLPSGLRVLKVQIVDLDDPRKSSRVLDIVLTVADVNDRPTLPATTGLTVPENSPVGTIIATIEAVDQDDYQMLTYSVQGNLQAYFTMVHVSEDLLTRYPDPGPNDTFRAVPAEVRSRYTPSPYFGNITRKAHLVVAQDSIDFESMRHTAVNGEFRILIRVQDEHYVSEAGVFSEPTDESPPALTHELEFIVEVEDVPDDPVIESVTTISPFGLTTAGGEEITLRGRNLGSTFNPHPLVTRRLEARFQSAFTSETFPGVNCRVTQMYVEVKCSTSPGFGPDYSWQLAYGGYTTTNNQLQQLSNWSNDTVTYASPNLVEFLGPGSQDASTAGNQLVRIRGSQFGTVAANRIDSVTYGPTGSEYNATGCRVVVDHSAIECNTSEAVGAGLRWVVVIAGLSSQTPTTSYAVPTITNTWVNRSDTGTAGTARTSGGVDFLIIEGNNFGSVSEFPQQVELVQYGLPEYHDSTPNPDTPKDQDCAAAAPIVSPGTRLNPSLDMVLTATKCRVIVSHTTIQCTVAPGMGAGLHVQVTIRGQVSPVSPTSISYALPRVDTVRRLGTVSPLGRTDGTSVMVLDGENFGRTNALFRVFFGSILYSAAGALLGSPAERSFNIETGSHTSRQFTAPKGHGSNISIIAETQCQRSIPVTSFSYLPPVITGMDHIDGGLANPPIRIEVFGENFGACCYVQRLAVERMAGPGTPPLSAAEVESMQCQCIPGQREVVTVYQAGTLIPYDCEILDLTENRIECILEYSQTVNPDNSTSTNTVLNGHVELDVGGQKSDRFASAATYQYGDLLDKPDITAVVPNTAPTDGGVTISLRGFNFGTRRENIYLLYWFPNSTATRPYRVSIPPTRITLWSDQMVNFTIPAGQGRPVIEMAFSGTTTFAQWDQFEYQRPTIDVVLNAEGHTDGFLHANAAMNPNRGPGDVPIAAPLLILRGSNFGVRTQLAAGFVAAPGIALTPDASSKLEGGLIAQLAPTSNGIPALLPTERLENFVLVGGKQCAIEAWQFDEIRCRAPAGVGVGHDIVIHLFVRRFQALQQDMWVKVTAPIQYSYYPPSISAVRLVQDVTGRQLQGAADRHGPTTGGALVEVQGSSFGASGLLSSSSRLEISVSSAAVTDIPVHTHSIVRFRSPAGQGTNLPLLLRVAGQSVTVPFFNYDAPAVLAIVEERSVSNLQPTNVNASSTAQGQLRFNAKGSTLIVTGANFGNEQVQPVVRIGDAECKYSSHTQTRIQCDMPSTTVGPKSLLIEAANQRLSLPQSTSRIFGECRRGFFGVLPGVDECYECPKCLEAACEDLDTVTTPASTCNGGTEPPVAASGFWLLKRSELGADNALLALSSEYAQAKAKEALDNIAAANNATDDGTSRSEFIFTRCVPAEGCVGNNTCAVGYLGPACSICQAGTHQRDLITGGCTPCPEAPELYMLGMLVAAIVLGAVLFKLYKKGPSVAALGIAVDYFQVLSVFSTLSLDWPESIVMVFRIASASAASVEVTSPECSVSMTYNQKWYGQMAVPLVAIVVLGIMHCFIVFKKWLKFRGRVVDNANYTKHLPAMIGFLFMLLSFLYISLCGKAFEVLRCKDVGGRPVLQVDTEVPCEGYDYERMRWWARLAIGGYGAGIPLLFGLIVFKSSQKMKVDQALRIRNLAGSRDTNPYYDMQKRFKRLYFKFKPERYYWLLVILARKFLIVLVSSLLFEKPMLASTSTVIVLFAAYSLQLLYMPYRQHTQQSKDEAAASGALGDEIPQHVLDKLKEEMAAAASGKKAAEAKEEDGKGASSTKVAVPAAPAGAASASHSVVNPLMRKPNPKALVDVHRRGVELDGMLEDRHLLMANDPTFVMAAQPSSANRSGSQRTRSSTVARLFSSGPAAGTMSGSAKKLTRARKMSTRTLAMHRRDSDAPESVPASSQAQSHQGGMCSCCSRRGKGADTKRQTSKKGACCGLLPAKGTAVDGLQLREEARKGGKTKVKVKYLYDYNLLETTVLGCSIFVLLSGVMFKSARATKEVPAGSPDSVALEIAVMVVVIGSTVICVTTVFAELVLGFKYFIWAGEVRRQREKEAKRRAILEGRKVQLTRDQKALLMWSKVVHGCPKSVRRACSCCCNVPAPTIITGAAYKATILKVAKGKTKETAAIRSGKRKSTKGGRRKKSILSRGRSMRLSRKSMAAGIDSDETDSESDGERQKREEAEKLAANAKDILSAAKPSGRRVAGLGVVENATPREFSHLKSQTSTSIHDSNVRREAILARLRAATKAKGQLPAGVTAPTAAASSAVGAASSKAGKLMADSGERELTEESTDAQRSYLAAQRAAAQEAALATQLGLEAGLVTRAVNSAAAAGILRTDGDDFMMTAAKKKKAIGIARYALSIHLGKITKLADKHIKTGQQLRMTLKTGFQSEKLQFEYHPLLDIRMREVKLLIFNPAEDTVHCTLYADFKDGSGSLGQHELVLGHLHFRTDELPEPKENRRVERSFTLRQYDGKVSGSLTLLVRLQHRGSAVDDWVELGMGTRSSAMPQPEQQRRGLFQGPPKSGLVTLQGEAIPAAGDAFATHNPLSSSILATAASDSDSKARPRQSSSDSDGPARRAAASARGGEDSKSGPSSDASKLAALSTGAMANTRRGKSATAVQHAVPSHSAARGAQRSVSGVPSGAAMAEEFGVRSPLAPSTGGSADRSRGRAGGAAAPGSSSGSAAQ